MPVLYLKPFFEEQSNRVAALGHEQVTFGDLMCQMSDMIRPKEKVGLRADDLLKDECRSVSGAVIDAMININK